ncbi:MAG TPA: DUF3099 domain-containing protein [Microlunatus sp.]
MTGSAQDRTGQTASRSGGGVAFGSFTVITDARSAASQELATRQRRYAITMAFRTACFIAMIFVPGTFRWILFAGAVVLPYIAVIFANQSHQRPPGDAVAGGGGPGDAPAITTGDERGQVISGHVVEEPDERVA